MDDSKKRIQRMAVWTVTVFATVFSVTMALFWLLVWPLADSPLQRLWLALSFGWPVFLLSGGLCAAVFFIYRRFWSKK
ncbi:MAG: hypothetical protein ABWK53_05740 [Anaerolineales bacterium]